MSATTRVHCRNCGRHKRDAGEISWQGYCSRCGHMLRNANNDQLHEGHGPFYLRWAELSYLKARKRLSAAERVCGEGAGRIADGG